MPKKARRGKAFQHKKKRMRRPAIPTPATSPVTAPEYTPTVPAPVSSASATKTKTPAAKYPFVTAELRRIGILAGAILVILVVLALVL